MDRFISITWSEGINEDESAILIQEVSRIIKWLYFQLPTALNTPPTQIRVFGDWAISGLEPGSPYWGTQWYIDSSFNEDLQQVIAPLFLELMRQEPWQIETPHWDLALIDHDLTDYPTAGPITKETPHYALGSSLPGSIAVMSVRRVRAIPDARLRQLALQRLVRHNLGHIMGAVSYKRDYRSVKHGLETHCVNRCAMRHASSVEELIEYAIEENNLPYLFCEQCAQELRSNLLFHVKNWS